MVKVNATIVQGPQLNYQGPGGTVTSSEISLGKWNLKKRYFTKPAATKRWSILELRVGQGGTPQRRLDEFIREVGTQMGSYDITDCTTVRQALSNGQLDLGLHTVAVTNPGASNSATEITDLNGIVTAINNIEDSISEKNVRARRRGEDAPDPLHLVFVLLPSKSASHYSMVKRAGDQMTGVHTICMVCTNIDDRVKGRYWGPRMDGQTIGNVLMKFNLKMRIDGVNQSLRLDNTPILDNNTMILGMDVVS